MPYFLVVAYDGTDPEAPARRQKVRPAHFENLKRMVDRGEVVSGGAILDEAGGMIGSTMTVEFPSRADLDRWLEDEPYVVQGVWQNIEVRPIRLAVPAPH